MAMPCIHGGECTGCNRCEPKPQIIGYCSHCKEAIYAWEDYYNIEDDTLLHSDCLVDWAEQYHVMA